MTEQENFREAAIIMDEAFVLLFWKYMGCMNKHDTLESFSRSKDMQQKTQTPKKHRSGGGQWTSDVKGKLKFSGWSIKRKNSVISYV